MFNHNQQKQKSFNWNRILKKYITQPDILNKIVTGLVLLIIINNIYELYNKRLLNYIDNFRNNNHDKDEYHF
jgi:hypothetical protein